MTMSRVYVEGNEWLAPLAAQQYKAAVADGMPGGCLTDGGRDPVEQVALFEDRYRVSTSRTDVGPFKDRRGPHKGRMWKRVKGAAVGVPGTSRHELGNAIDLAEPARSWLRAHPEYGFTADLVPGEPWHFELTATQITKSAGRADKQTPRKRKQMLHFYVEDSKAPRGVRYVILMENGATFTYTSGAQEFPNAIAANIGNAIKTDDSLIAAAQKQLRASAPPTALSDTSLAAIEALLKKHSSGVGATAAEIVGELSNRLKD